MTVLKSSMMLCMLDRHIWVEESKLYRVCNICGIAQGRINEADEWVDLKAQPLRQRSDEPK